MELRRFPRVEFKKFALIRCDGATFSGEVENIGMRGVFIGTGTQIPIGSDVEISISLTHVQPETVLQLHATVVRVSEEGIAFRFGTMGADTLAHLQSIAFDSEFDVTTFIGECR